VTATGDSSRPFEVDGKIRSCLLVVGSEVERVRCEGGRRGEGMGMGERGWEVMGVG
jgi:hypothetical protein